MDSENENRPLLYTFENDSFRSRMRRRCMRIPSEVTFTGVVIGLFLIVVSVIIVFENSEAAAEDDLKPEPPILASPLKFNKKPLDKTWKEKKNSTINKTRNGQKWDNINKRWKTIQHPAEKNVESFGLPDISFAATRSNNQPLKRPLPSEEYGKEIDDSIEQFTEDNENIDENSQEISNDYKWKKIKEGWKKINTGAIPDSAKYGDRGDGDGMNILSSPKSDNSKLMKEDAGWKRLSEQGWKKKDLEAAVREAWEESQDDSKVGEAVERDSANHRDRDGTNRSSSPKTGASGLMKEDVGWKKLSEQGWKKKDIEAALREAWKESQDESSVDEPVESGAKKYRKDIYSEKWTPGENTLESPLGNLNLWLKGEGILKRLLEGGSGAPQMPKSSGGEETDSVYRMFTVADKKEWSKRDGWKMLLKQGWTEEDIHKALRETWKKKYESLSSEMQ